MKIRPVALALLLVGCVLFQVGCATHNERMKQVIESYKQGNFQQAADLIAGKTKDADKQDRLIAVLEEAKVMQDAGRYDASIKLFDEAVALAEEFDLQPEVRISQEGAAMFTDPSIMDFRGRGSDLILMNTYQCMNYMVLGNLEQSRVFLRRAYDRQKEAIQKNAERIEDAEKAEKEAREDKQLDKDIDVDEVSAKAELADSYKSYVNKSYADYANPFTTWLDGLCAYADARTNSDLNDAGQRMARVRDMMPDNIYARLDAEGRGIAFAIEKKKPLVYVIFETGLAPRLEEVAIRLPRPSTSISGVDMMKIALPKFEAHPPAVPFCSVKAGGKTVRTQSVASLTGIYATEYDNALPTVILRAVLSTIAKEVAKEGANLAAKSAGNSNEAMIAQALVNIGGVIYSEASTRADLRTWLTAGADIQIAMVPRPADDQLQVIVGSESKDVNLPKGLVTVVLIRTVGPVHSHIRAFRLPVYMED